MEELEEIANTSTKVPGLRKKVMVDVDRLNSVVEQMSTSIPADILEAKEVLKQKESILNQTQLEANRIKDEAIDQAEAITVAATQEHAEKVDDTEITRGAETKAEEIHQNALQEAQQVMQDAQRRAYKILEEADTEASVRRDGADQYAREKLFDLEERLSELLGQVRRGIDSLGLEVETSIPSLDSRDRTKDRGRY